MKSVEIVNIISVKAQKIARIREDFRMSANAFGAKCGYSGTSIYRIERGKYAVVDEICQRICTAFDVNEEWLMNDERRVDEASIYVTDDSQTRTEDSFSSTEQGERLREVIKKSGLSQKKFYARIGGGTSGLAPLLDGRRPITQRFAEKIEREFGVGVDWLLYGMEEAKEKPCDSEMIFWLKRHPEWREKIWEEIRKESDKTE